MKNFEIARIFYEIADILEMQEVAWKPNAYRKAARSIEGLSEDIATTYAKGGLKGLKQIPGVGEHLAKKIEEFLKTGKVKEYTKLRKSIPAGVESMMHLPGMGPKKAWTLFKKLNIKNLTELKRAATQNKIQKLTGFSHKTEQDILRGLILVKQGTERQLLGNVLPIAKELLEQVKGVRGVQQAEIAGSIKRRKESIKDIDILVVSKDPTRVMNFFTTMKEVSRVIAKGQKKSSVRLKQGINSDLRVIQPESFGAAQQYFTGSKEHNVVLRQIAIKKGYKLSEYGLFKGKKQVAGKTEKEIYRKLGLQYVPPELRENNGEIQAAQKNKLPALVTLKDIQGDCHMHTTWSDGAFTTAAMATAAKAKGYDYIAITDHSKALHVAKGLDEKRLKKHVAEIKKVNQKIKGMTVFAGAEVDILADGSLDYDKKTLEQLDIRIASIHSRFKESKQKMTKRIVTAIESGMVHILSHPTGRKIHIREPYAMDFMEIIDAAKKNNVALEINSQPVRLDINDTNIRAAVEHGCKVIINTDSHHTDHLNYMELGVAQARRGWAKKKDVINTKTLSEFKKFLAKR